MSRYFSEESGQTCKWAACIFCKRKWLESSLELELCPKCISALRSNPGDYEGVKIEMLLKYGEFSDENLAEAIKLIWKEIRG